MVHLYWGDGKGKTTAAMGLALRALGHGRKVVIVQFLKDGSSGEIAPLRRLGAAVYACPNAKFTWLMNDAERAQARENATAALRTALTQPWDLLVLDEACAAWQNDLVDRELLRETVARAQTQSEVVLTGRKPAGWMQDAADYSTEMRACKHPYTKGVSAREGIEY
ncbi:cob(I)yrinic acid a,c-diamide adenosyltransferase [Subdoligranulum variabile]|uniref:cob(I)yrinic acid a,c-diamide adenosyltransferase n=1 Tax=Subdoligranulum variabile TaxID=214851 RepID=UPI0026EBDF6C|nr:cob(I)yrinic acid a,c-diamide adenosyltransferase [Subdoligranulum variabile]